MADDWIIDFPTLADLQDAWVRRHVRQPDGILRGKPFCWSDWQFWYAAHRWRVREDAEFVPPEEVTVDNPLVLNQAFQYRLTGCIGPQKTGKGPTEASCAILEACGPVVFAGWAKPGDAYRCSDNGCPCGWVYHYNPGEPKGMRHPSPLIQLTANSEDQVRNAYRPLVAMIRLGPLKRLLKVREGFIRILRPGINLDDDDLDLDRIDVVTASATSRLGNPISDAEQDEAGLYTKSNGMLDVADTQRRGAAGMGGRTHFWNCNAYDPGENSYAQQQFESASKDVWIFYRNPDLNPVSATQGRYAIQLQQPARTPQDPRMGLRRQSLGALGLLVEAEAEALMEKDPAQAERFFGNRMVQGGGAWLEDGLWESCYAGQ